MIENPFSASRRQMLRYAGAAAIAPVLVRAAQAQAAPEAQSVVDTDFVYEVRRTEAEWRAMLSDHDYAIMREMGTELRKSSPLWNEERSGNYHCKGCGLHLYDSAMKVPLDIGWVFFEHARPATTMTAIDEAAIYGDREPVRMMEVHCRRCGGHLGHIVSIEDKVLHCLNGASLTFDAR